MPNWCLTSYIATGDGKEVRDLYEKMKSLENSEKFFVENNFGKTLLGNLVSILGGDWTKIDCRGEFFDLRIDDDEGALRFETTTAWCEPKHLRQLIQSKYPSLDIYYRTEEPCMGYFKTNDADGEYFPELIKIENWNGDPEYYETWEEVFQIVAAKTDTTILNIDEMQRVLQAYNEEHKDAKIYVYQFTIE